MDRKNPCWQPPTVILGSWISQKMSFRKKMLGLLSLLYIALKIVQTVSSIGFNDAQVRFDIRCLIGYTSLHHPYIFLPF
jgi:hypothetical protein